MRWKKSVTATITHGGDEVGDLDEDALDREVVLPLVSAGGPLVTANQPLVEGKELSRTLAATANLIQVPGSKDKGPYRSR